MKTFRNIATILAMLTIMLLALAFYSLTVQLLWNFLANFFELKKIDFIHSFGLMMLVKTLITPIFSKKDIKELAVSKSTFTPKMYN